jgi:uncharacterized protein YecE (DUF72 family)
VLDAGAIRLGAQGWSYADWVGPMYDADTKPNRYLRAYAREFNTVEIDSTFYGTPPIERVARWCATVPAGFTFAIKVPREITHERHLRGCERETAEFFASAHAFGEKLEAVLVQLGPDFSPDEFEALAAYVDLVPSDSIRIAVEVRDARWFVPATLARLRDLLGGHGIALALSDGIFVPLDAMLAEIAEPTADFLYLRWLGARDAVARYHAVQIDRANQVAQWATAIERAPARVRHVTGYVNNHYSGHSPATVRQLLAAFGVAHIQPPRIEQTSMF